MNNTVSEMKTIVNEVNRVLDTTTEEINELEDVAIETTRKGAQNNMKVLLALRNKLVGIFSLELFFYQKT